MLRGSVRQRVVVVRAQNGRSSIVPFSRGGKAASSASRSKDSQASNGRIPQGNNNDILSAFFYGRAFAVTVNKRLSEVAVDVISEVSKALAERPTRMKEFQEEVESLARKELISAGGTPPPLSASSTSTDSITAAPAAVDVQAAVDELRAEIAYARASLQQYKQEQPTV